jgi:two-component system, NarL family, uhpT operon response regulator UhpA
VIGGGARSAGAGGGVVRVAIVDDERMVLDGLHAWLAGQATGGLRVVAAVTSWARLLTHPEYPVDVVLLDLNLKDGVPVEVKLATLRAARVSTVVISTFADPAQIRACIAAGARAYLPKSESADEMMRAALAAAAGHDYITQAVAALLIADREVQGERSDLVPHLSPQETRALTLYASGLPMKAVARRLQVSYDTAKDYVDRVRQKYEEVGRSARTKVELYQRALEDGFIAGTTSRGPGAAPGVTTGDVLRLTTGADADDLPGRRA